jgi:hypothetical protein
VLKSEDDSVLTEIATGIADYAALLKNTARSGASAASLALA